MEVATRLSRNLEFDATEQFVTMFYVICSGATRALNMFQQVVLAVCVELEASPKILEATGMPIGIAEPYDQQTNQLSSGSRIYRYSAGITEAMSPDRSLFGVGRLLESLSNGSAVPLPESNFPLQTQVVDWQAGFYPKDDISILAVEFA